MFRCCVLLIMKCTLRLVQVPYAASPAYIAWGCSADTVIQLTICISGSERAEAF